MTHDGVTARIYYVRIGTSRGDRLWLAQRTATTVGWNHSEVETPGEVERISVHMRSNGTDVLYVVDPDAGEQSIVTVPR